VESNVFKGLEWNRERLSAAGVEIQFIRVLADPAFGCKNLFCRLPNRSPVPPSPIAVGVASVCERARLVRKDDHIPAEYDQEITEFLSIAFPFFPALIAEDVGVAPKAQKALLAQIC
jgi:hypothetical protein